MIVTVSGILNLNHVSGTTMQLILSGMTNIQCLEVPFFLATVCRCLRNSIGNIYLDHAGTSLYARSLMDAFSKDMMGSLLGNPHSASASSQLSTERIDDIRLQLLQFFNASPDHFDIVFVANATAGIKLVTDAFRDQIGGFWYAYHRDAHTSLVGARETAMAGHHCFESDSEVEDWLSGKDRPGTTDGDAGVGLFAYPAQSNMNGRRLPRSWPCKIRSSGLTEHNRVFTLLDAAALVSTSPLDLGDEFKAPDFTVLSFNKVFGFPDLGALIVRKEAGHVLEQRKYFGGGTVEMVVCLKEHWHIRKQISLHEQLEDGTLPVHSIVALDSALKVHKKLFGSMVSISSHTAFLAKYVHDKLAALRHGNGRHVTVIYKDPTSSYNDSMTQGPVLAFNLRDSYGAWISNFEVEKLASIKDIHLRTGGLCNPGGVASSLGLAPWELKRNFSAGQRCGNDNDVMAGKPTGVIRVSLGAMSNMRDVLTFVHFIEEFFVDRQDTAPHVLSRTSLVQSIFHVESLTIYPIKSSGGWSIPPGTPWDIRPEGLAWDREWCLVHRGTRESLSQKRYPKMALIRPSIDFRNGLLRVQHGCSTASSTPSEISIPLSADPSVFDTPEKVSPTASKVCGETVPLMIYTSNLIASFFTDIVGTPCTLARFPPTSSGTSSPSRHSKAHLQPHQTSTLPSETPFSVSIPKRPILLSNESPILTISRSSLDALNSEILARNPNAKSAHHSVFRANIVIAPDPSAAESPEAYIEDTWRFFHIVPIQEHGSERVRETVLEMLGSCRRCQMVCVDQTTAEKNEEPFATLAKTRRMGGKVWFGVHGGLVAGEKARTVGSIMVGDRVRGVVQEEGGADV